MLVYGHLLSAKHLSATRELVATAELGKPRPVEKVPATLSLPSPSSPRQITSAIS